MAFAVGIAVPIREWNEYAEAAVQSFIRFARPVDRLIVSLDSGESSQMMYSSPCFRDNRIRLIRTPRSLSMAAHYEWCLDHLDADWLTILGQDDALLFNFSDQVEKAVGFAESHGLDAVSFKRAYFNWPDGTAEELGYTIKYSPHGQPRIVQANLQIIRGLCGMAEHYTFPQVYTNNLIRRETIKALREDQRGRVFLEPIPDTYSGVAVATHLGRYLRWPIPIFWTGTSKRSAGVAIAASRQVPPHIRLANEEGRFFGVSQKYWVEADHSSVYIYSALATMRHAAGLDRSRFQEFVCASSLMASSIIASPQRSESSLSQLWKINVRSEEALPFIQLCGVAMLGLCLLPLQLCTRILRKIRFELQLAQTPSLKVKAQAAVRDPNEASYELLRVSGTSRSF